MVWVGNLTNKFKSRLKNNLTGGLGESALATSQYFLTGMSLTSICLSSWCLSMFCSTSWPSYVTLPGASLWLWHFLGLICDCETSWWHLPGSLYDCGNFWDLLMIVTFYQVSLWLRHFLGPLNDYDTSQGLSMIMTLLVGSIWLWHFLRLLYHHSEIWYTQCLKSLS